MSNFHSITPYGSKVCHGSVTGVTCDTTVAGCDRLPVLLSQTSSSRPFIAHLELRLLDPLGWASLIALTLSMRQGSLHRIPSLGFLPVFNSEELSTMVVGQDIRDEREVGVLDHDLIQLPIVLYEVKQTILLLDEEHRGSHGGLGWMDVAIHKVLPEEVVKLLLFCRGQGECLGVREFSPRCEINGVVPCLPWWELVKGFLGEDISEVVVLGWHHVFKGLASFGLLGFLGQPRQWGIHSPNVVFHPLRGDECGINRISGFWSIVLHHASI